MNDEAILLREPTPWGVRLTLNRPAKLNALKQQYNGQVPPAIWEKQRRRLRAAKETRQAAHHGIDDVHRGATEQAFVGGLDDALLAFVVVVEHPGGFEVVDGLFGQAGGLTAPTMLKTLAKGIQNTRSRIDLGVAKDQILNGRCAERLPAVAVTLDRHRKQFIGGLELFREQLIHVGR